MNEELRTRVLKALRAYYLIADDDKLDSIEDLILDVKWAGNELPELNPKGY